MQDDYEVDVVTIFEQMFKNWILFLLVVFLSVSSGMYYYYSTPEVYKARTKVINNLEFQNPSLDLLINKDDVYNLFTYEVTKYNTINEALSKNNMNSSLVRTVILKDAFLTVSYNDKAKIRSFFEDLFILAELNSLEAIKSSIDEQATIYKAQIDYLGSDVLNNTDGNEEDKKKNIILNEIQVKQVAASETQKKLSKYQPLIQGGSMFAFYDVNDIRFSSEKWPFKYYLAASLIVAFIVQLLISTFLAIRKFKYNKSN
jgi:hypothetical protein